MSRDAIVDEVRAVRDAIARENNYDLEAIFRMLQRREAKSGKPHVTLPPKRINIAGEHARLAEAAQHRVAAGAARRPAVRKKRSRRGPNR